MSAPVLPVTKPKVLAPLDPDYLPIELWMRSYEQLVAACGSGVLVGIGLARTNRGLSTWSTHVLPDTHPLAHTNLAYIKGLVKALLWMRGGYRVYVGGPRVIGEHVASHFCSDGQRHFDVAMMSTVYEQPFEVVITTADQVPKAWEKHVSIGDHLEGCRIGFDLGASDRKASAVIDGQVVFSEEVIWNPLDHADPRYHYHEIMAALHHAAAHLPRVDAIGGSAAGIYVNNRVRVASLFRAVPDSLFDSATNLFLDIKEAWGVPLEVVNDGEVTALAGSMSLGAGAVLGIAMGSFQAGGYVDRNGCITEWLNELTFVPVDCGSEAVYDPWSGDLGCGTKYFAQQAVIRLAEKVGIELDSSASLADRLKTVQQFMDAGDARASSVYETIGVYLGYTLPYYARFYDVDHVLLLGRVTSGPGGEVIRDKARAVLEEEFPELDLQLHLPDEQKRRVGQAVAAASLARGHNYGDLERDSL